MSWIKEYAEYHRELNEWKEDSSMYVNMRDNLVAFTRACLKEGDIFPKGAVINEKKLAKLKNDLYIPFIGYQVSIGNHEESSWMHFFTREEAEIFASSIENSARHVKEGEKSYQITEKDINISSLEMWDIAKNKEVDVEKLLHDYRGSAVGRKVGIL